MQLLAWPEGSVFRGSPPLSACACTPHAVGSRGSCTGDSEGCLNAAPLSTLLLVLTRVFLEELNRVDGPRRSQGCGAPLPLAAVGALARRAAFRACFLQQQLEVQRQLQQKL
ncbi:hypothetical protein Emed_001310 [Eimeria media]